MKRLLAKSYTHQKHGDSPPDYALLTQHSRDVAEACNALALTVGRLTLFNAELDEDVFENFRLTLRANGWMQDLGKVSSHFQTMVSGKPKEEQMLRHEAVSGLLMLSEDQPFRAWLLDKFSERDLLAAAWGAMGHHRKFDAQTSYKSTSSPLTIRVNNDDFRTILEEMAADLRLPSPPPIDCDLIIREKERDGGDFAACESLRDLQDEFEGRKKLFRDVADKRKLALIKALGICADVAASAVAADAYEKAQKKILPSDKYSLTEYIEESMYIGLTPEKIEEIVVEWAWRKSEKKSERVGNEIPPDVPLRKFQKDVAASESLTTFAQAGCGSGKSIAAYEWARVRCEKSHRSGQKNFRLFFCLPTTGTTTEQFKDYALESGIDPKLMGLTHSRSRVDLQAIAKTAAQEEASENSDNPAEEALKAERDKIESLALWSTPLVVSTADTVLGLMANARRAIYSLPAIMCGAFVFDEIHAYDEQMFGHLLVFLKNFPKLPVLLMTASLPKHRRAALEKVRPDINRVPGESDSENLPRYILRATSSVDEIWQEVRRCVEAKGKVLWVRNQVDWANETYDEVMEEFPHIPVNLYHARLRYTDRANRHRRVIDNFKRKECEEQGSQAAILVTTQVAEMSLDLSADLLVTDIAPIPALIQRLGRLNRRMQDLPLAEREAKPALVCPLPENKPGHLNPYEEKDFDAAREWLKKLQEDSGAVSQSNLSEAFAQFDKDKEFDLKRAEEEAYFFSGIWETRPGQVRGEGHTISVILQEDKEKWESDHPGQQPTRDWLREHEVAIPLRAEISQWNKDKFGGLRVAPREAVEYDYDKEIDGGEIRDGKGAGWRKK
ncbi:MAG: CRISPR-associated endonuclease/helicase Cas3 [Acidobacteriota bacterium]|jgi:CRISPR-associated endonuclease/helicase Cas3|nr:CRISPR-associated endonuclease/helicase Cas3 [Acidobacteriota bacterium]